MSNKDTLNTENNTDKIIKENIVYIYDNIDPNPLMNDKIMESINSYQSCNNSAKKVRGFRIKNIQKFAVLALVSFIICIVNYKSISAFVRNTYEYFFESLDSRYDNIVDEYIVDVDQVCEEDNNKIRIIDYVVTENGIDVRLKVEKLKSDNTKLVGCEITVAEANTDYDFELETLVKTNGTYIASFKSPDGFKWGRYKKKTINATVSVLYETGNKVETFCQDIKLDVKNILKIDAADKSGFMVDNDLLLIKSIDLHSWYVIVTYEGDADVSVQPELYYKGKQLMFLTGRMNNGEYEVYYEWAYTMDNNVK